MISNGFADLCILFSVLAFMSLLLRVMMLILLILIVLNARMIRFALEVEANKVGVIDGWSHRVVLGMDVDGRGEIFRLG